MKKHRNKLIFTLVILIGLSSSQRTLQSQKADSGGSSSPAASQSQKKPGKSIGGYVIPPNKLADNYCHDYNITKFDDIKEFQLQYRNFFSEKVKDLREPVYEYLKTKDYVRKIEN